MIKPYNDHKPLFAENNPVKTLIAEASQTQVKLFKAAYQRDYKSRFKLFRNPKSEMRKRVLEDKTLDMKSIKEYSSNNQDTRTNRVLSMLQSKKTR